MAEETAPVVSNEPVATPTGDTVGTAVEQPQQQTDPGAGAADETPVVELNDEQKASWSTLPPDIRKQVNKLFTQKTQDIAAERQALGQIRQLHQALIDQPDLTVEMLARQRGFKVEKPQAPAPNAQEQAQKDQFLQTLEEQFGAQGAQAIVAVAERLAESKAEARVKPLADFHNQNLQERDRADAASAEEALGKEFPDYKQYVPQMQQLAQKLQPMPGMSKLDFARLLYKGVSNGSSAQQTNAVIAKLQASAKAAEPAAQSVSNNRVAKSRPKDLSFDKQFQAAAEAAQRGEEWQD